MHGQPGDVEVPCVVGGEYRAITIEHRWIPRDSRIPIARATAARLVAVARLIAITRPCVVAITITRGRTVAVAIAIALIVTRAAAGRARQCGPE